MPTLQEIALAMIVSAILFLAGIGIGAVLSWWEC